MKLLASLCNVHRTHAPPRIALLEIDPEMVEAPSPIAIDHPDAGNVIGITGLARHGDLVAAVLQAAPSKVALLDKNYELKAWYTTTNVRDGHSLTSFEGKLFIVSSGTDSLVELDPVTGRERVIWKIGTEAKDNHHLNSVIVDAGRLLVSGFGPKKGELWSSADDGFVIDVATGEKVVQPIYHPHSLVARHGHLYWCVSSGVEVMGTDGLRLDTEHGYCRGLAFAGANLFVGSSKARTRSKSTGKILSNVGDNPADHRLVEGGCEVLRYEFDSTTRSYQRRGSQALDAFGGEIYDLLTID